jgi:hypothetical protein
MCEAQGCLRGDVEGSVGWGRVGGDPAILGFLLFGGLCRTAVLVADIDVVVVVVIVFLLGLVVIEVFVLFMVVLIFSIVLGVLVVHVVQAPGGWPRWFDCSCRPGSGPDRLECPGLRSLRCLRCLSVLP